MCADGGVQVARYMSTGLGQSILAAVNASRHSRRMYFDSMVQYTVQCTADRSVIRGPRSAGIQNDQRRADEAASPENKLAWLQQKGKVPRQLAMTPRNWHKHGALLVPAAGAAADQNMWGRDGLSRGQEAATGGGSGSSLPGLKRRAGVVQ